MTISLNTHYFINIPKSIKLNKLVFKEYDNDYIVPLTSKKSIVVIKTLYNYKKFDISYLIKQLIKNKKHVKRFIYKLYKNNIINKDDFKNYNILIYKLI